MSSQPRREDEEVFPDQADLDDIQRYVMDDTVASSPLKLNRTGGGNPSTRPPTRRENRDPLSPSGSYTSDQYAGSQTGDSRPPSDPHDMTAALGDMQLDDGLDRVPPSRPRQVSDRSRPPLAPLRIGDVSRPPLTPMRMGRAGLSQSPASSSSGGSSGDRRPLSRRLASSNTSFGPSNRSSSGGSASPSSPSQPSPTARALRAGGRRLSRGLINANRVAQGLLGKRKSSYKGCPHHGLELCHSCCFRIVLPGATYDDAGKVVVGDMVDAPLPHAALRLEPVYGRAARFQPLYDAQLRAAEPPASPASPASPGDAGHEVAHLPDRFAAPQRNWFTYCLRCELTHFVGSQGLAAAASHPSHCANAAGERSVAIWVDAAPLRTPRGPSTARYSIYCGRGSRFNLTGDELDFTNAAALEFKALARALRLAEDVLAQRRQFVARCGISNSHAFLWGLTRFRLLIFSPLKALGQWLQTEGLSEAPENPGHFLNFDKIKISPRHTWLEHRRHLDDAIARLADLGVEVSFYPWRTPGYTPEWKVFP